MFQRTANTDHQNGVPSVNYKVYSSVRATPLQVTAATTIQKLVRQNSERWLQLLLEEPQAHEGITKTPAAGESAQQHNRRTVERSVK